MLALMKAFGTKKSGVYLEPMLSRWKSLPLSLGLLSALALAGCDEEKPAPQPVVEEKAEEPEAEPEPLSAPHLVISESGPAVRGMSVMVDEKTGKITTPGLEKLKNYLSDETKFIEGQELTLTIDRKAKQGWVAPYLNELGKLGAKKVTVKTETRSEYPSELEFVLPEPAKAAKPCTLVGGITEDNATAIWRVSGGTARKRHKGLGGPDLSMTSETIASMSKSCESDLIFVSGAKESTDWAFVYDLAASATAIEKGKITRAALTQDPATPGNALSL